MNKEVQPVVLVLVGAAVLKISLGEAYLRYVKESLQPFLVASGVVLVLLGLLSAWKDLDRGGNSTSSAPVDHAGDGHDRAHGGPGIAWMLLLPVAAIFLVAPPALGADAASRDSGTVAGPRETSFVPLPEGDPVPLSVADYAVRAGWGGAERSRGAGSPWTASSRLPRTAGGTSRGSPCRAARPTGRRSRSRSWGSRRLPRTPGSR